MRTFIRHPKDFWTGIIFLFFGAGAVLIGQDYAMGSAGRMGPAYFPTVLGSLLAIIGLIGIVRSLLLVGEPIGRFYMKELVLILIGILLFGFLMRGAGLVPAIIVLIFLAAFAGPKFNIKETAMLAAGLAIFAVVVFVKLLGLPMAAFGPWFGF
ncbi:MAG: tripartite tricarboxylate transporter TctB family protein [Pseudomonadota bacterium]